MTSRLSSRSARRTGPCRLKDDGLPKSETTVARTERSNTLQVPAFFEEMKLTARQPRDTDKTRIHVLIEDKQLAVVDRAARKLGFARSHFVARAAFEAAKVQLEKAK